MFSSEDDPVTALSDWASIACELEHVLRKTAALVVRTHVYGWTSSANEPGYASLMHQALGTKQAVSVGMQCHANPILATDLADLLVLARRNRVSGLLHLAGAERVDAGEFARTLASAFGLPAARLRFPSTAKEKLSATETSLDSTRARMLLGTPMPLLREGLARFAAQASDFRWRLRGSEPVHRRAA
jgi:dTDP-4-dehydrorhamnose reductase